MADKELPLLTQIRVGVRLNGTLDYRRGVVTSDSVFLQTVACVENVAAVGRGGSFFFLFFLRIKVRGL